MNATMLSVEGLHKHFRLKSLRTRGTVRAVDGVDLALAPGETLGLVGESGSGKTTLASVVAGLEPATSGRIIFDGTDLTAARGRRLRALREHVQVVFQDPYASFAPMTSVGASVGEPLVAHGRGDRTARKARVAELLELVGLRPELARRYPAELSGGQLQRASIARALALSPKLVILDEAVSALDVSTKAQVINLLGDLQERLGLAYLFISHDLATLRYLSDRVAVMYLGRIVETGPAEEIYARARHPYTEALLSAVPVPNPAVQRRRPRLALGGDIPSPLEIPPGCRFQTRCPHVTPVCRTIDPPAHTFCATTVACHLYAPDVRDGAPRPSMKGSE